VQAPFSIMEHVVELLLRLIMFVLFVIFVFWLLATSIPTIILLTGG